MNYSKVFMYLKIVLLCMICWSVYKVKCSLRNERISELICYNKYLKYSVLTLAAITYIDFAVKLFRAAKGSEGVVPLIQKSVEVSTLSVLLVYLCKFNREFKGDMATGEIHVKKLSDLFGDLSISAHVFVSSTLVGELALYSANVDFSKLMSHLPFARKTESESFRSSDRNRPPTAPSFYR